MDGSRRPKVRSYYNKMSNAKALLSNCQLQPSDHVLIK
jgi:hypothetical protein